MTVTQSNRANVENDRAGQATAGPSSPGFAAVRQRLKEAFPPENPGLPPLPAHIHQSLAHVWFRPSTPAAADGQAASVLAAVESSWQAGDLSGALAKLEEAAGPEAPASLQLALGTAYWSLSVFADVFSGFERQFGGTTEGIAARSVLPHGLDGVQARARALAAYEMALGGAPNLAKAHYFAARLHHINGELRQAIGHYEQALLLVPGMIMCLYHYASALADMGQAELALQAFELLTGRFPLFVPAHKAIGDRLREQGDGEAATARYQEHLNQDFNDFMWHRRNRQNPSPNELLFVEFYRGVGIWFWVDRYFGWSANRNLERIEELTALKVSAGYLADRLEALRSHAPGWLLRLMGAAMPAGEASGEAGQTIFSAVDLIEVRSQVDALLG